MSNISRKYIVAFLLHLWWDLGVFNCFFVHFLTLGLSNLKNTNKMKNIVKTPDWPTDVQSTQRVQANVLWAVCWVYAAFWFCNWYSRCGMCFHTQRRTQMLCLDTPNATRGMLCSMWQGECQLGKKKKSRDECVSTIKQGASVSRPLHTSKIRIKHLQLIL